MAISCRNKKKCYTRKDGNKCLTPNAWIIFLRTNQNKLSSIGQASARYHKHFKPVLEKLINAGSKDARRKQQKAIVHKTVCTFFYQQMKASGKNTATNKKKVRSGVARALQKNGIPKTLKIMGAKHTAAALAAKEKDMKKADADLSAKEQVAAKKRLAAEKIIRRAVKAVARARLLKKKAVAAKTKSSGGQEAKTTASNKAKRKADTLYNDAERAMKKVAKSSEAVASAQKTAAKVAKRKIPRALAALDTDNLSKNSVAGKRKRRGV